MTDPVLIVGGGIGGLTAALALQRHGVRVQVFERATRIGDVGAGISLGPTASRGLYSLGLEASLRATADTPRPSAALHFQTREVLGGSFADRDWRALDLSTSHHIHRADLYELLTAAVRAQDADAIHLDHVFLDFSEDRDGVTAEFANGRRVRGSALIGCDGIRSTVRARLWGSEEPRFTGWVVYRFLVPMERARPYMSTAGTFVGPGRSLLRYTVRHGSLVNCVTFVRSETLRGEGWSQRASTEELLALFPDWHPDARGLAASAPFDGTAKWALYDRDPLPAWTRGRTTLLGDAAHPMLPFLGLGAATTIEDAVVLGRAFGEAAAAGSETRTEDCLRCYERARRPRANTLLLESRHQGQIFDDGPDGERRPLMSWDERNHYDPATVPLG